MNRLGAAVLTTTVAFTFFNVLSRGNYSNFGRLGGMRVERKPETCKCNNDTATTSNNDDDGVINKRLEDVWWDNYYNSTMSPRSESIDWKSASKSRWTMKHCSLPPLDESDWVPEDVHRPGQLVLVYQYGKCGSTAMTRHLKRHLKGSQVLHVHSLSQKKVRAKIQKKKRQEPIWIVTMVRNRFVRDISALFENFKRHKINKQSTVQEIISKNQFVSFVGTGGASQHWFTDVFRKQTGVDVLQHASEFNSSRRSLLVTSGLYRILLLRYEDIADWGRVVRHYFPSLSNSTMGRAKLKPVNWLDKRYNQMLTVMPYQPAEIAATLAGDTAHFYTECELQAMARSAAEPLPAAWV